MQPAWWRGSTARRFLSFPTIARDLLSNQPCYVLDVSWLIYPGSNASLTEVAHRQKSRPFMLLQCTSVHRHCRVLMVPGLLVLFSAKHHVAAAAHFLEDPRPWSAAGTSSGLGLMLFPCLQSLIFKVSISMFVACGIGPSGPRPFPYRRE
ncbi:hypothetical protein B0T09DRAFT_154104 [Sordaria sp. MPI-SDFR-AT-0083]|nr:hypothetical protein B0T09DRAFT_154104 [Sordaria sp. MPI-SDFR-AT-0083]